MQKEARFKELIADHRKSGLSIIDFCSNHGIAPSTFHYWKKKLSKKSVRKDFIPLVVKSSGVDLPEGSTCSEKTAGKETSFELVYPNGTILRIQHNFDLALLRTLIHLYD
jgi:transposase-like protein